MAKSLAGSICSAFGRRCSKRAIVRGAGGPSFWVALRDVLAGYGERQDRERSKVIDSALL